ncbi:hypothetical protein F4680DRAFT_347629 [Xylaria scruposa]|nr:hypothetical protein F4680DRAFT_347629 [Xylaria scruposa]
MASNSAVLSTIAFFFFFSFLVMGRYGALSHGNGVQDVLTGVFVGSLRGLGTSGILVRWAALCKMTWDCGLCNAWARNEPEVEGGKCNSSQSWMTPASS